MSKIFLSHSSKDKDFVKLVADELGNALCHYDERTFEPSGQSADEILVALNNSEIFALFLSKNSLGSPWVTQEINYARHMFFSGQIKSVAVFPLDDTTRDKLDVWLQPFVVQTLKLAKLVGLRLRSILSSHGTGRISRFVGRDHDLSVFKESLREKSPQRPAAIIISGTDGIGKRKLMSRTFQDIYPALPAHWVEIDLDLYEGEAVLYERLLGYFEPSFGWSDATSRVDSFLKLTSSARAKELGRIFLEVEKSKQVVLLRFAGDIVNTEGSLDSWLLEAIRSVNTSYPVLAISTIRGPSPRALAGLSDIPFIKLNSLEEKYAEQLFKLLCEDEKVYPPDYMVDQIVTLVGGHPGLLELSSRLIKAVGVTRFRIDLSSTDGRSALEEYVEKLLSNLALNNAQKATIILVDELGGATREDILYGFSPEGQNSNFSESLANLLDFGLLEDSGGELRSASHLRLVMRRWKSDTQLQDLLVPVRKNLVAILDEALSLEGGSYSALRAPIAAAIRADGDFSSALVSKPLLAAQQLRVARRLYDDREFEDAAEKAKKAYEYRIALSDDGVVEALRILGLSGVRRRDQTLIDFAYEELDHLSGGKAKKIVAFIRGFEKRLAGDFKAAEAQLRLALDSGGSGDFHVLRELAASLLEQERPQEAEEFARGALRIAPTNPYIIDILSACLIDRLRESVNDYGLENEIEKLLSKLSSADDREHRSFGVQRKISFALVKRDFPAAKVLLDRASRHANKTWYRSLLAEYYLRTGDSRSALEQLDGLHRPLKENNLNEGVLEFGMIRRTRVLAYADAGRLDEAVAEFERQSRFLGSTRKDSLHRELIGEIARSTATKSDVVKSFASKKN